MRSTITFVAPAIPRSGPGLDGAAATERSPRPRHGQCRLDLAMDCGARDLATDDAFSRRDLTVDAAAALDDSPLSPWTTAHASLVRINDESVVRTMNQLVISTMP